MPRMTVTKIEPNKFGKMMVYFDGKTHWKDGFYLGKTPPPPIGHVVDADTTSLVSERGNTNWFLNSWKPLEQGLAPSSQATEPQRAATVLPHVQPQSTPGKAPTVRLEGDELRFVSNVVGQAISSQACKIPGDVRAWWEAAKACLSGETFSWKTEDSRRAGEASRRIIEAINQGKDTAALEVWRECAQHLTSLEFNTAVFALLPMPVRNHLRDLENRARGQGPDGNPGSDVDF